MSAAFNVSQYWLRRGENYFDEAFPQEYHRLQERFLCDVLRAGKVPLGSVLELGCGFGRITRVLAQRFPQTKIHATDLSEDLLVKARKFCGGHENVTFSRHDFCSDAPIPSDGYDTVIAVEVFLHQPTEVVLDLFRRLPAVARFIVHIDWSEEWRWATPEHVWVHPFRKLYEQAGLRCAAFTLPEKVDELQQQLFVGGRELTPELLKLEQVSQANEPRPAASSANIPTAITSAQWLRRLTNAVRDLREIVPRGSTLILVDENTWGNPNRLLPERRVLPFLERNGQYWGPPPDDATAIRELERMRLGGARYLVVAWNALWWLRHYREFHLHLRQRGRCVLASDDVMLFEL